MSTYLISGANGFVGRALCEDLISKGHRLIKLSRSMPKHDTIHWNPEKNILDLPKDLKIDIVIHLAGENILGFWTKQKKEKICQSRVLGTKLLVDQLLTLNNPPKIFISASAIGYYGSDTEGPCAEDSPAGQDFLGKVCLDWEAASTNLRTKEIRLVHLRFGVIISPKGGMLKQMCLPFRLGLGAYLGSGKQVLSWVSLQDVIGIIGFCVANENINSPINVVAPAQTSNKDFCRAYAKSINKPCFFGIPKFLIKLFLGRELGAHLLWDQKITPAQLLKSGYQFHHPSLGAYFSK